MTGNVTKGGASAVRRGLPGETGWHPARQRGTRRRIRGGCRTGVGSVRSLRNAYCGTISGTACEWSQDRAHRAGRPVPLPRMRNGRVSFRPGRGRGAHGWLAEHRPQAPHVVHGARQRLGYRTVLPSRITRPGGWAAAGRVLASRVGARQAHLPRVFAPWASLRSLRGYPRLSRARARLVWVTRPWTSPPRIAARTAAALGTP